MQTKLRLIKHEHNQLVKAITRARNVLMLLEGIQVTSGKQFGVLKLEKEVLGLTNALQVLGLDAPTPLMK